MAEGVRETVEPVPEGKRRMGGYHAMARKFRVGLQNAVRGRVVASCVHRIRTCFIKRGWEPHIFGVPACDGYFCHVALDAVVGYPVSSGYGLVGAGQNTGN